MPVATNSSDSSCIEAEIKKNSFGKSILFQPSAA